MGEQGNAVRLGYEGHLWPAAFLGLSMACAGGSGQPNSEPARAPTLENSGASSSASSDGGNPQAALSVEDLTAVVYAGVPRVKAACWQPALDARTPDAPRDARVLVSVKIAPSGEVTGIDSLNTPPGYPQLPGCVRDVVKTWKFPQARGPTTVSIPFVFVAQEPARK